MVPVCEALYAQSPLALTSTSFLLGVAATPGTGVQDQDRGEGLIHELFPNPQRFMVVEQAEP